MTEFVYIVLFWFVVAKIAGGFWTAVNCCLSENYDNVQTSIGICIVTVFYGIVSLCLIHACNNFPTNP